jgi:nitrite reductase (NADH) large subunit
MTHRAPELVVVGSGASGRKFLASALEHGLRDNFRIRALDERADRRFTGSLRGLAPERETVLALDPARHILKTASGRSLPYDSLVLATGRRALPVEDLSAQPVGCFSYRSPFDLSAIEREAAHCRRAVIVGGGRRGLHAAGLLRKLGLETHIVEHTARLLPAWLDDAGGLVLQSRIAKRGVEVHLGLELTDILSQGGRLSSVRFSNGSEIAADLLVLCPKIQARDELGRSSGLKLGERDGIAIDEHCQSNDPDVFVVGSVASFNGHCLNWPAAEQITAQTAARVLAGEPATLSPLEPYARFRALGVDIATFGDSFGRAADSAEISIFDSVADSYVRLSVAHDGRMLTGGMLVGRVGPYRKLLDCYQQRLTLPKRPGYLVGMLADEHASSSSVRGDARSSGTE